MAELTTLDGAQYDFVPTAVVAVTDPDARLGETATCVYGLTAAPLRINEPAEAFLIRIGMVSGFALLTRPDGSPIWICGPQVAFLHPPLPGEYAAGVRTVITADSLSQGVKEEEPLVKAMINAHGGRL